MIDFKEKLHNDVNEILNESVILDEGLGSALLTGGKTLGKGILGGAKLAAKGAKAAKNKWKNYKANKSVQDYEKLVNKATVTGAKSIAETLENMEDGIVKLQKVQKIEEAKELMTAMINACNSIIKDCNSAIGIYDSALTSINAWKDNRDKKFF